MHVSPSHFYWQDWIHHLKTAKDTEAWMIIYTHLHNLEEVQHYACLGLK